MRSHKVLQQDLAGMNGLQKALFWSGFRFSNSIVGHQIDIVGIAVVPDETELPPMIEIECCTHWFVRA
jgi:hypothetical protein